MIRSLLAGALALGLAACAMVPERGPLPELSRVPAAFEMSGRLSIRQADKSDIAKIRWTRRNGEDTWVIASPLGNEIARIESNPAGAVVAGAAADSAPSFETLTERVLGVALSPDQLAAWLHGEMPERIPGGWKVVVEETQAAGAVTLARRLTASRGEVVVKLVVDEYRAIGD
jgi:outer membrane biogenesis lipoprotein LolB